MTTFTSERDLSDILGDLIEIPLRSSNSGEAIQRLVELCRKALGSQACTLVTVDLQQRILTQCASAGFDEDFNAFMAQREIRIGALPEGLSLDYDLIARGDVIKKHNLSQNGGGIANSAVAKRYQLHSALCYPLTIDGRLVGFLNHFSSKSTPFTTEDENLLRLFSNQAENVMKQFNNEMSLRITKNLLSDLLGLSASEFLRQLPNRAHDIIPESECLVWQLDSQKGRLKVVAASNTIGEEFQGTQIDYSLGKLSLGSREVAYWEDIALSTTHVPIDQAKLRGWVSLLSVPMWARDEMIGILDVYTKVPHQFTEPEVALFQDFATLAVLCIQKANLQKESTETSSQRQRLEAINHAMTQMAEETSVDKILRLLLTNSLHLVGVKFGWVRRLNPSTGNLEVTSKVGTAQTPRPLPHGQGVESKAVVERKPQIANDVRFDEWKGWYVEFSPDTRSELAIPLIVDRVAVREGRKTKLRSRAIGVMNLESPEIGAFSEADISYLLPLVRQAALLIDRLEAEHKASGLREVQREIIGKRNWREVLETVVRGIRDTLGFDYVNVSLVDATHNVIRSEYVVGLPNDDVDLFKSMAVHSLDSADIQADVIRTKEIEVPERRDPRFDQQLFNRFQHDDLIRVFIPMVSPSNGDVIGTVEAGYHRHYRDFIYESDVRFLQSFIAYATEAIAPSRITPLEAISHELRSSIVGIRSNADFLRQLASNMDSQTAENKLNDILADSEILLLNVGELEYFLGRTSRPGKVEATWVIRDIIIKTVNQLKPLVRERRLDPKKIGYPRADVARIKIYVEKPKLNQVVYNLLLNSIKYAEDDPESFSIQISVADSSSNFVVRFADWGMGIKHGLENKVFEYGFRSSEARARNVSGSGLGLTIARERMRELGGDLILVHNHKPTEFHMLIPKKLTETPI